MRRCRLCRLEKEPPEISRRGPSTCKACAKARLRIYVKLWRQTAIARLTARRNNNKQRKKASRTAYMKQYRAAWAAANREKMVASRERYKASAKGQENDAAYRARLRGAEKAEAVDPTLWARLVEAYDGACAYCRVAPANSKDHIIPLSLGGIHAIENLVPACRSCNSRKHAKSNIVPPIPLLLLTLSPGLHAGLVRTVYGNGRKGVRLVS